MNPLGSTGLPGYIFKRRRFDPAKMLTPSTRLARALTNCLVEWYNRTKPPKTSEANQGIMEASAFLYLLLPSICCPSSVYPLTHHYPLWFQAFADKNPQISTDLPGQSHQFWVPLDRWASEEQLRTSNTKGSGKRPDNPDVDRRRHMARAVKSSQS